MIFPNFQIVDLEDTILQLKEDLIQERADARMEKRRLKKAVVSRVVDKESLLTGIDLQSSMAVVSTKDKALE